MSLRKLAPRAIGLKYVKTDRLEPNPHNPRLLFDRADLATLKGSIERVGILVPLTVYKEAATGKYRILDGQRRWICAGELGLPEIPVNQVAEPSLVQNIVTMFQIHKLRRDWELMPTALKLEVLMNLMKETRPRTLASLTGLDEAVVVRCKKLLTYPKRYQDMMLLAEPSSRVKADFFIELHAVLSDRAVRRFQWFDRNKFTDAMLRKMDAHGLRAVTEFRAVKQHISNAVKAHRVKALDRRLHEFAEHPALTPDHVKIASAEVTSVARKIGATAEKLREQIAEIDLEQFYGEDGMWRELEQLASLIRLRLLELGRRIER